jgi:hypothetical protein
VNYSESFYYDFSRTIKIGKISDSHGGENKDDCFVGLPDVSEVLTSSILKSD